jgi:hypothetical protein
LGIKQRDHAQKPVWHRAGRNPAGRIAGLILHDLRDTQAVLSHAASAGILTACSEQCHRAILGALLEKSLFQIELTHTGAALISAIVLDELADSAVLALHNIQYATN